jgi:hypothetical protein
VSESDTQAGRATETARPDGVRWSGAASAGTARSASQPAGRAAARGVLHYWPAQRLDRLGRQLVAPAGADLAAAGQQHHRLGHAVDIDAKRGPVGVLPLARLHGQVGEEDQLPRGAGGVAGHQVVDRAAVGLAHPGIQQGGRAAHQQAARGGQGGGQGLVDQQPQGAVGDRVGVSSSPKLLGPSRRTCRCTLMRTSPESAPWPGCSVLPWLVRRPWPATRFPNQEPGRQARGSWSQAVDAYQAVSQTRRSRRR